MKNAGEYGDELAAFVISEINGQPYEEALQIVYARVLRALQGHRLYVPPKPPERKMEPMNVAQSKVFRESPCPFEKYRGVPVAGVPITYLCRLCDPSPWIEELRRYLASEEGKRRIEEGE